MTLTLMGHRSLGTAPLLLLDQSGNNWLYLNLAASFSVSRASTPVSAPTATNRPPQSSHRRASASTPVRIPGAFPALRMRREGAVVVGLTLGLFGSPGEAGGAWE